MGQKGGKVLREKDDTHEEGSTVVDKRFGDEFGKTSVQYNDFEICGKLGEGSFGTVFHVRKNNGDDKGKSYAMKVLDKAMILEMDAVAQCRAEEALQERAANTGKCKFIVNLRYAFQTLDKLCIVLDLVSGGDLFDHLAKARRFTDSRAKLYAAETCCAIEYLHGLNIVYRDLKMENILLDTDGHIRLTDFGLAKELRGLSRTNTVCGTPEFMAPEVSLRTEQYDTSVDWWSFGVLIYVMLTGRYPFERDGRSTLEEKVRTEELFFPPYMSPEAADLIRQLMLKETARRLRGVNIRKHPWFRDIDWEKLEKRDYLPEFKPDMEEVAVQHDAPLPGVDWVHMQMGGVLSVSAPGLTSPEAAPSPDKRHRSKRHRSTHNSKPAALPSSSESSGHGDRPAEKPHRHRHRHRDSHSSDSNDQKNATVRPPKGRKFSGMPEAQFAQSTPNMRQYMGEPDERATRKDKSKLPPHMADEVEHERRPRRGQSSSKLVLPAAPGEEGGGMKKVSSAGRLAGMEDAAEDRPHGMRRQHSKQNISEAPESPVAGKKRSSEDSGDGHGDRSGRRSRAEGKEKIKDKRLKLDRGDRLDRSMPAAFDGASGTSSRLPGGLGASSAAAFGTSDRARRKSKSKSTTVTDKEYESYSYSRNKESSDDGSAPARKPAQGSRRASPRSGDGEPPPIPIRTPAPLKSARGADADRQAFPMDDGHPDVPRRTTSPKADDPHAKRSDSGDKLKNAADAAKPAESVKITRSESKTIVRESSAKRMSLHVQVEHEAVVPIKRTRSPLAGEEDPSISPPTGETSPKRRKEMRSDNTYSEEADAKPPRPVSMRLDELKPGAGKPPSRAGTPRASDVEKVAMNGRAGSVKASTPKKSPDALALPNANNASNGGDSFMLSDVTDSYTDDMDSPKKASSARRPGAVTPTTTSSPSTRRKKHRSRHGDDARPTTPAAGESGGRTISREASATRMNGVAKALSRESSATRVTPKPADDVVEGSKKTRTPRSKPDGSSKKRKKPDELRRERKAKPDGGAYSGSSYSFSLSNSDA